MIRLWIWMLSLIGMSLRRRGRYQAAEPLLRRALRIGRVAFAQEKRIRALLANNLGLLYKDLGRNDEAAILYRDALRLLLTIRPLSRQVATLYHNLGGIELARGSFVEAERFAKLSVEIRRRAPGATPRDVAIDEVALAAVLDSRENYEEAEAHYKRAIGTFSDSRTHRDYELAVAKGSLGALYLRMQRLDEAGSLLNQSLAAKQSILGTVHPDLALSLNNLGVLYVRRGDRSRAKSCFERALHVLQRRLGKSHPRCLACRNNLRAVIVASSACSLIAANGGSVAAGTHIYGITTRE